MCTPCKERREKMIRASRRTARIVKRLLKWREQDQLHKEENSESWKQSEISF